MSLATFKKKSVVISGSNISGKPVYEYFLPSGPFGTPNTLNSTMLRLSSNQKAVSGFSLNGPYRSSSFFKQSIGTPYRGPYAKGNGGSGGRYYNVPVYNVNLFKAQFAGNQNEYVKNSTVSTYTMLRKKYRYLYTGQYPNYWVQPNTGFSNLSENSSQGLYLNNLTATYSRVVDTNDVAKYIDYKKNCGLDASICSEKPIIKPTTLNYTKFLYIPQDSSQYTTRIQRKCVNPLNYQKPFPGLTNGGTCNSISQKTNKIFIDKKVENELNSLGIGLTDATLGKDIVIKDESCN
jgi:hypothetical protein